VRRRPLWSPWVSSSSSPKVLDSSTVITPSLPTLSIASAMILPIWASWFAAQVPTWAISVELLTALDSLGLGPFCPFVAPDESYLIFNKLDESGNWAGGHYISFKGSDGEWLPPQRLPDFPEPESVFVTRDGAYIFNKSYWASAQFIEAMRPPGRN